MADDPTFIDPKPGPPPVPEDSVKTDPDSPFAAPPKITKGKFAPPPPEVLPPTSGASKMQDWGKPTFAKTPIANGPPQILGVVCLGWLAFTAFQLYVWLPEEGVIFGCPGIAGIATLLLAVYAWSGRNWARIFAMINAAAWAIAAVIVVRTPAYEGLAPGEKPITVLRAAFEIFAGYALNRPECVAFFELRKGYVPKW